MQVKFILNIISRLISIGAICLVSGCFVTMAQFDKYKSDQELIDKKQTQDIKDIGILVQCNNKPVRDFIKDCATNGLSCPKAEISPIIEKMKSFPHRMLRIKFVKNETPKIEQDQMADLSSLFQERRTSTRVLLVAISGHRPPEAPKKLKRNSQPKIHDPFSAGYTSDIDPAELYGALHKLRETFKYTPYGLSVPAVEQLDPQIPTCDNKSDKLVNTFRSDSVNSLRTHEAELKKDYFDLIVFMVDCQ